VKLADLAGTNKGNIRKTKLTSFKQTIRTEILALYRGIYINLRRVTNLDVTWKRIILSATECAWG
jgi:hypothetical protein